MIDTTPRNTPVQENIKYFLFFTLCDKIIPLTPKARAPMPINHKASDRMPQTKARIPNSLLSFLGFFEGTSFNF